MTFVPYVELTVTRQATSFTITRGASPTVTVTRGSGPTFTTYGHPGNLLDGGLLTETGLPIFLESGDVLLA